MNDLMTILFFMTVPTTPGLSNILVMNCHTHKKELIMLFSTILGHSWYPVVNNISFSSFIKATILVLVEGPFYAHKHVKNHIKFCRKKIVLKIVFFLFDKFRVFLS